MFGWFCPRRCDSTGGKVFTGFILNDAHESEEAGIFKARGAPLRKMEQTQRQQLTRKYPGQFSRVLLHNAFIVTNLHSTGEAVIELCSFAL